MVSRDVLRLRPCFLESLLSYCDQHLEHNEPRVRTLVAATLGALTKAGNQEVTNASVGEAKEHVELSGLAVYCFFRERLLGAISANFERTNETITDAISGAQDVAVDDTSGWKALETSLLALKVTGKEHLGSNVAKLLFGCFACYQ